MKLKFYFVILLNILWINQTDAVSFCQVILKQGVLKHSNHSYSRDQVKLTQQTYCLKRSSAVTNPEGIDLGVTDQDFKFVSSWSPQRIAEEIDTFCKQDYQQFLDNYRHWQIHDRLHQHIMKAWSACIHASIEPLHWIELSDNSKSFIYHVMPSKKKILTPKSKKQTQRKNHPFQLINQFSIKNADCKNLPVTGQKIEASGLRIKCEKKRLNLTTSIELSLAHQDSLLSLDKLMMRPEKKVDFGRQCFHKTYIALNALSRVNRSLGIPISVQQFPAKNEEKNQVRFNSKNLWSLLNVNVSSCMKLPDNRQLELKRLALTEQVKRLKNNDEDIWNTLGNEDIETQLLNYVNQLKVTLGSLGGISPL